MGLTFRMAATWVRAWAPQPITPRTGRPGPGQILGRQAAGGPGAEIGVAGAVQVGKLQPGIRIVEKDLGHHREQALGRVARVAH